MKSSKLLRVRVIRASVALAALAAGAQANAACTFGASGEPSLQGSFDTLLGSNAPNTQTGCLSDGSDAAWTTMTGGATILLELAGNANTNSFGLYDLSNPNNRISIFSGSDTAGTDAIVRLTNVGANDWQVTVAGIPATGNMIIHQPAFGFYLGTATNGTFFSQTVRNTDGLDHMYAYQGNNGRFLTGPLQGSIFQTNDYILAWEDLPAGVSDRDYQDFVVDVLSITPTAVPIPSAIWLAASGLIGLFGIGRSKRVS